MKKLIIIFLFLLLPMQAICDTYDVTEYLLPDLSAQVYEYEFLDFEFYIDGEQYYYLTNDYGWYFANGDFSERLFFIRSPEFILGIKMDMNDTYLITGIKGEQK